MGHQQQQPPHQQQQQPQPQQQEPEQPTSDLSGDEDHQINEQEDDLPEEDFPALPNSPALGTKRDHNGQPIVSTAPRITPAMPHQGSPAMLHQGSAPQQWRPHQ